MERGRGLDQFNVLFFYFNAMSKSNKEVLTVRERLSIKLLLIIVRILNPTGFNLEFKSEFEEIVKTLKDA